MHMISRRVCKHFGSSIAICDESWLHVQFHSQLYFRTNLQCRKYQKLHVVNCMHSRLVVSYSLYQSISWADLQITRKLGSHHVGKLDEFLKLNKSSQDVAMLDNSMCSGNFFISQLQASDQRVLNGAILYPFLYLWCIIRVGGPQYTPS